MADPPQTAEALLARLGLSADSAMPVLRVLGIWTDDGPDPASRPLLEQLAAAADPQQALKALSRLAEQHPEAWARLVAGRALVERAAVVAGASSALGDLIATRPDAVTVLAGDLEPWDVAEVHERAAAELAAGDQPSRVLAQLQRQGILRVAARDLLDIAELPQITAELSALAEGLLDAALGHVVAGLQPDASVAVVAMGKLGGAELNYVSDVDVMFVCDGDWEQATRVCEQFLRICGAATPDGRAYEVDPNLRPEGRDGPLVRTLDAYQAYYERWAKTWEFQALLKARPIAGDRRLGAAFSAAVQPFVWPDRLEADAVAEIQRLKGVVESSKQVVREGVRQVKLGPGGLRDIEFAVQLLQLVHGRHDPSLRSPNTLGALAALAAGGYVDEADAELFDEAYRFLRTVEHRLQLRRLRRTHTLPRNADEREQLARTLGYRSSREAAALEQFEQRYRQVQAHVRRLHEKLFYRPLLARFAELGAADQVSLPGAAGLDEDAARERLTALGFAHPDGALSHLDALATGLTRRAQLFRTLLPAVLPVLAESPDPDAGLAAFRSLADRLGDAPFFLHTLRDNPPVGELLVRVLGRSRLVGEWLERQPEVFGLLVDLTGLARRLEPEEYRRLAAGLLRRGGDEVADALRRLRRREMARVAVRDLGGLADVGDVAVELTGLAEACLEAAVGLAVPDGVRMAVVGLGKLGGRELAYPSDLDVLLVFEPGDAHAEAQRAAEDLLRLLGEITPEGQAFRVDPNLRPEGKSGPLARTLESCRAYYERWGEHWEFQALTQARPVGGDAALGAAFCEQVADLVYPADPPADRLAAVRRMKARVERERAGGRGRARDAVRRGDRIDLKLGEGGLSDVEWTVQLLQLRHGGRVPEVRRPGTLAGTSALVEHGLLEAVEAEWLREGYLLLSRLRNVLFLAGFRNPDVLPPGPRDQERLARTLGYAAPGGQALVEDLSRAMRRIRKVHERRFYDA